MATLSAHLRKPDGHGRLGFHPQCPVCRNERLAGGLPVVSLSPRRVQAGVTAGVLALTSVAPTAAFATDGTPETEGSAPPEQVLSDVDKEIDPGEDAGSVWQDGEEAPEDAGVDAGETPDVAPDSAAASPESAAPEATPDDFEEEEAEPSVVTPVSEALPAATGATPAPVDPVATLVPASTAPGVSSAAAEREAARVNRWEKQRVDGVLRRAKRASATRAASAAPTKAVSSPTPVAPAPTVTAAPAAPATTDAPAPAAAPTTVRRGSSAPRGADTHVVQRGESLWSIAADVLGDDASPAKIAREVNRLWELNTSRIGTGDRNLLIAGTRLEL